MMDIIPAIDIIDGKCVRLTYGDFASKKVYDDDPVQVARRFQNAGIRCLHVVDLDGARSGKIVNSATLQRIAENTDLQIDFGGGVKNDADLKLAFTSGADQVTAGSIAVEQPETVRRWLGEYGSERIILGADVRQGYIAVSGWQKLTQISISAFLDDYLKMGVRRIICTDISRDGALSGPSVGLYTELLEQYPELEIVASGGVSSINDVRVLNEMNMSGVIIGKALYEGKITLDELQPFLNRK